MRNFKSHLQRSSTHIEGTNCANLVHHLGVIHSTSDLIAAFKQPARSFVCSWYSVMVELWLKSTKKVVDGDPAEHSY